MQKWIWRFRDGSFMSRVAIRGQGICFLGHWGAWHEESVGRWDPDTLVRLKHWLVRKNDAVSFGLLVFGLSTCGIVWCSLSAVILTLEDIFDRTLKSSSALDGFNRWVLLCAKWGKRFW